MTMFERVVSQVILGYLGRYFKDIQKHQLKITLWKGSIIKYLSYMIAFCLFLVGID